MKREELKKLALTDDQIDKVMSLNGLDIEKAKKQFDDYDKLKKLNESLNSQISEQDKDLKNLKKQSSDNDELSLQFKALKKKYKIDTDNLMNELQQTKLNNAIDNALSVANVRNVKATRALLNMDELSLNKDGGLDGISTQLDDLKKSDAYLFDQGQKEVYEPSGGENVAESDPVKAMTNIFNN